MSVPSGTFFPRVRVRARRRESRLSLRAPRRTSRSGVLLVVCGRSHPLLSEAFGPSQAFKVVVLWPHGSQPAG